MAPGCTRRSITLDSWAVNRFSRLFVQRWTASLEYSAYNEFTEFASRSGVHTVTFQCGEHSSVELMVPCFYWAIVEVRDIFVAIGAYLNTKGQRQNGNNIGDILHLLFARRCHQPPSIPAGEEGSSWRRMVPSSLWRCVQTTHFHQKKMRGNIWHTLWPCYLAHHRH